jgi:predicted outer membrane protein
MTRTLSAMAALLAAGALFLTGCAEQPDSTQVASADGDAKSSAKASPSPTLDREEQALKFVECMRKNGVDMPDPGPNGSIQMKVEKGNQATMEKAQEACREFAPSKLGGQQADPKQVERIREFTTCMRDHGVKMADPDPNNPGMIRLDGKNQDPDKLEAAQEACGDIMQGTGPGPGGN